jgi:RNA polymerase sigma-70 factor (ECF subfamily)
MAAAETDTVASRLALERLCVRYWYPVYAFVRQRGHDIHDAEDLTQGFFYFVLEHRALHRADRRKGRFRTFILSALTNFLHNEHDKAQCYKRGGHHQIVPLDEEWAEAVFAPEAGRPGQPEAQFERHWATMLVREVLDELQREHAERGKESLCAALQPWLTGEPAAADYERLGQQLKMESGTVKVTLHRLRRRFGELLRREVAYTVDCAEDVEVEIRHLLATLAA